MKLHAVHAVISAESEPEKHKPPRRRRNADVRAREYLTQDEVDAMIKAARATGRNGSRDALAIEMMARHGLRVSELCGLTWDAISFGRSCTLYVTRRKKGISGTHYLADSEIRALKRLQRQQKASRYIFVTSTGTPLSVRSISAIVQRAGEVAELGFSVHPHMLRHATGYRLVNRPGVSLRDIQSFLGHAAISSTTRYCALSAERLRGLEK